VRPFPIIAICTCLLAQPCLAQEGTGSLTGVIRYEIAGRMIDATLQSETLKTRSFRTTSDNSGAFRFSGLPADDYTLKLETLGSESVLVTSIHVSNGERRSLPAMDLIGAIAPREAERLRLPARIRALPSSDSNRSILNGSVVATTYPKPGAARPAASAEVRLICANGKVCGKTQTDSSGLFHFTVPFSATFLIRVRASGFYPWAWSGYRIYAGLESTYEPIDLDPLPKGFFARWFRKRPIHYIQ